MKKKFKDGGIPSTGTLFIPPPEDVNIQIGQGKVSINKETLLKAMENIIKETKLVYSELKELKGDKQCQKK